MQLSDGLCSPVLSPVMSRSVKLESKVLKSQAIIHPCVYNLLSRVIYVEKRDVRLKNNDKKYKC